MKARRTRVSDLADVATCQRRVYLRAKLGDRKTPEQAAARARGEDLHERAFRQNRPDDRSQDRRCFIATSIYGADAPETHSLRTFRDRRLMPYALGRAFVVVYYRASPGIAALLDRSPALRSAARVALNLIRRVLT